VPVFRNTRNYKVYKVDPTYDVSAYKGPTYVVLFENNDSDLTTGVTMGQVLNNQQVTKEYCNSITSDGDRITPPAFYVSGGSDSLRESPLVGTSEAERSQTLKLNEWLAGLIDGDGCFLVSKEGYTSCEIIADLLDEPMLLQIKNRFGGSVKRRSGSKAVRWRLHNTKGMLNLVNSVNGLIRNTKRVHQLERVCNILNINYIPPKPLYLNSGWYAGFFDADGTITFSVKGNYAKMQLRIGVTNRLEQDIIMFKERFGGGIYYDRSQNGYYSWSITKVELIHDFIHYSKICPIRSIKGKRLLMVPRLYELKSTYAFKADPNCALYKVWLEFKSKWDASKA
jgi:ubiquinol-cytochrome c reductase cytochrome b subunit